MPFQKNPFNTQVRRTPLNPMTRSNTVFQTRHVSGITLSHPMQGSRFIHSHDSTVGAQGSSPRVFVRKTSLSGDYYPPVTHTTLEKNGGDTA
ncbi:hypothetical protein CEXT_795021, partial [Caerostris extrusa]